MNLSILPSNLPKPIDDGKSTHLFHSKIPEIGLPNQDGNLLRLNRIDTFRLIIYCYPMTGNPIKPLPENWNNIPGARGCTSQTCSFRDHYEELIKLNSVPIGLSTQSIDDIKEMTKRLLIPYDVVSDDKLKFTELMKLPTFNIKNKIYIKRITLIIEKSIIKKVFYPIFPPDKHIFDVLKWLRKNN